MIRCLLVILAVLATHAVAQTRPAGRWVGSWACAQQAVYPNIAPPAPGLANSTLRQVVRLTVGGCRLRVRFANDFGTHGLAVRAAHVARPTGRGSIDRVTDMPLTFDGKPTAIIPACTGVWSDPVDFAVPTGSDLAVTLWLGEIDADHITTHPGARCTSFAAPGDAVSAETLPNAVTSEHWYFLSGVDVLTDEPKAAVVVTLGDSITDGRGSTTDQNARWPDALARRLAGKPIAVLNAGIGGNRVLHDGLGPSALARFDRDVLAQTSVRRVIVLEGVNDLGTAAPADADATAGKLIEAYRQMIVRAHDRGVEVFGGTITPFAGSQYDVPEREAARQRVNTFVRGGAFDGVIDFDAAIRDPARPTALRAGCDSGDHLHLNDHGYRVMADAVDLKLLTE